MKIFILLSLLLLNNTSRHPDHTGLDWKKIKLPVCITYTPLNPPDSIQQYFIKSFEQRKITLISKKEMQKLTIEEIQRVFNLPKNNQSNPEPVADRIKKLQQPVCNSLHIHFESQEENNAFVIKWKTYTQPVTIENNRDNTKWQLVNTDNLVSIPASSVIESVVDSIIASKKLQ